jgi:hypothetical protein
MMLAQDTNKRHHRIRDKPSEVCVGPVLFAGAQFAEEGVTGPRWRIWGVRGCGCRIGCACWGFANGLLFIERGLDAATAVDV